MANILLIEPNTALARVYQDALSKNGHDAVRVASAQAAVEAADTRTPDVVILELQLPRHSGIEFLHEFRSYTDWWDVPIIINTAIPPADLAEVQQPLRAELGVRAILYKPTSSLQTLLRTVQEQLAAA